MWKSLQTGWKPPKYCNKEEYEKLKNFLKLREVTYVPIAAVTGDNIVESSPKMSWFKGPSILHILENLFYTF